MAKMSLPAISDNEEIDEDVLTEALSQGAQHMPSLSPKKVEAARSSVQARPVPAKKDDAGLQRVTKAISLPRYVWDWIKAEHRTTDETQNVVIMRTMKKGGAPIREEDLVDGRLMRR
jgi:hypothetical protein